MMDDPLDDPVQPVYSALTGGKACTTLPVVSSEKLTSEPMAAELAAILLGTYPDHGKLDPEIYLKQVIELFMEYPEWKVKSTVMQTVRTLKWLPALAELAETLGPRAGVERVYAAPYHAPFPDDGHADRDPMPEERARVADAVKQFKAQVPGDPLAPKPKKWSYDPSKAYRYPSWWLLLTTEERFELQALGHVPQPMRADQFVDSPRPADW